jgi:hypothetical protein
MGTWGAGIAQDDTVADVVGFLVDRLKAGDTLDSATALALSHFSGIANEEDEAPLLWMAIAKVQWKYGTVESGVLGRVRSDIKCERGLDRWRDDSKGLAKRKAALAKFLAQVEQPNPKPEPPPKCVIRRAPFKRGDCLSVQLPDGRYTAALVLKENNSNPEHGMNLVASLDYCQSEPPTLDVFQRKKWLKRSGGQWRGEPDICWYLPVGLKKKRSRISVVGNIRLGWLDPKGSRSHVAWSWLGAQVLRSATGGGGH